MKYYLLDNRILYQTKDAEDKVIGFGVKQPVFMKQYPYYKLSFSADGSQCIVQTEMEVKEQEAKELTLAQAQEQTNKWYEKHEKCTTPTEVVDEETGVKETFEMISEPELDVASYNCKKVKEKMNKMSKAVSING